MAGPLLRASWAEISLKLSDQLQEPRVLGRGASSIVYRARWLQCDVAAKVLHNNSPSLVDSAALFRELELLRSWGQHECLTICLHEPNCTVKNLIGLQDAVENIKSVELVFVHW
jgi:hypothetical protein